MPDGGAVKLKAEEMDQITITLITNENLPAFSSMITDEARQLMATGSAFAIGAILDDTACGALACTLRENVAHLLSLYVAPGYRRQYVGSTLFCELADFLENSEDTECDGITVEYVECGDGTGDFFNSLRFVTQPLGAKTVSLPLSRLDGCSFMKKNLAESEGCVLVPVSELSAYHLRRLDALLDQNGANYLGVPITAQSVVPDCSVVCYQDGDPTDCVCVSEGPRKNELFLSVMYIGSHSPSRAVRILQQTSRRMLRKYPAETVFKLPLVSESATHLAQNLLEGAECACEVLHSASFEFGGDGGEELA